jgi:hypothetical protein
MVWEWLDAARYADSNGYQGDGERTMWPWRDWAIDALNRNLPFDQFTVWQLAGDLLAGATPEQKLATAFCRNHPINGEGGRIAEENRVDYVMDMAFLLCTMAARPFRPPPGEHHVHTARSGSSVQLRQIQPSRPGQG